MAQVQRECPLGNIALGWPLNDGVPRWCFYASFAVDDDVIYQLQTVADGIKGLGAVRTGVDHSTSFLVYMDPELTSQEHRRLAEMFLNNAARRLKDIAAHQPYAATSRVNLMPAMAISSAPNWLDHS